MTIRLISSLLLAVLVSGCAAPINRHTASNYYEAGETAMARGDLPHAREMFSRALINVRLGNMGPEAEGQVLGKLGRVYGNMCQYDDAEKAFSDSISAYSSAFGEQSPRTFPSRIEIAQFSYDIGRYEKAVMYFEQVLPLGASTLKAKDPAGFVAIMTDYSDALAKVGKTDLAEQVMSGVAEVKSRASGVDLAKVDDYVRYPTKCD